uniref:K Homology domain-containing protein n=1 Tax=Guillardia theta TaxID=55529 RepID=A0A7S4U8F3_GUITH|mmetsp:Transcript_5998/g.21158  ORF Transcript_5998/g.21158 Transcript_5998/m.21158 type:complete len:103 (+) Transcript_5998:118-426(+)
MKNDPDTKHLDRTPASSLPAESKRSLRVKSSSVGRLIGTGGANIKNLQQEARKVDPHVQIDIREDRKDKEVHEVTVTGTKEATEFVVEAIKGRLKEAILAVI